MTKVAAHVLAALVFVSPASAEAPKLALPVLCEVGKTCWVQQYADHDPSGGVQDYACGAQTYDGHDGTDLRVRNTRSTAEVIAAAAGTVSTVRDGARDRLIRSAADRAAVAERECGNGVLIQHEDGWETQYCHLRQGSIAVKQGDAVAQGQKLGTVGYSGLAEFPHVHLSVRQGGKAIDPFHNGQGQTQCGALQNPLWTQDALAALAYRRSDVLGLGLAPGAVKLEDLEDGGSTSAPSGDWPAMVAYVWAINLQKGDTVIIRFEGPEGFASDNSVVLDRAKAQYLLFTGKKRPEGGWPKGLYRSRVEIINAAEKRLAQEWEARID